MRYLKTKNNYLIKLDTDEEIIATLKDFVLRQKIKSGFLIGIGTGKEITLGFYDTKKKMYHKRLFPEEYEFASLIGNVSYLEKEPIIHIHCTVGPINFTTYSGHLFSAKVGATCEILITTFDKKIIRTPDAKTGLNLLNFGND
ncbi:MAG: DNA-binding protein [candidate division WOR-3 bacterium]|nr:DNA-binding protein [candidate division WOR-3 bacterium]